MNMIIYGKIARKYESFPELFTPFEITKNTEIQPISNPMDRNKSGNPIPSSISFSCMTSFLCN
jgi:hypothetical protein